MLIQWSFHGDFDHDSMGFRGDLVTMGLGFLLSTGENAENACLGGVLTQTLKKSEKIPLFIGLL